MIINILLYNKIYNIYNTACYISYILYFILLYNNNYCYLLLLLLLK